MDLNHLYSRHQAELMRADHASCVSSRKAHQELARLYKARIDFQSRAWRAADAVHAR